jgi:hypothetical protein
MVRYYDKIPVNDNITNTVEDESRGIFNRTYNMAIKTG